MKHFFLILLFPPLLLLADNPRLPDGKESEIDSLNQLLPKANPDNKVIILNELSKLYVRQDNAQSLSLAQEALKLSKQLKNKKSEAMAIFNMATAYFYLGNFVNAKEFYLQSIILFAEVKNYSQQAKSIQNLGLVSYFENDYHQAILHLQDASEVKNIEEYPDILANILMNIGLNYYMLGEYDPALQNYFKALELFKDTDNKENYTKLTNRIGALYWGKGDYDKAIEYLLTTVQLNEEMGNTKGMATAYNNLGAIYNEINEEGKALGYYQKALELNQELQDLQGTSKAMTNMGNIYRRWGDNDKALELYTEALGICKSIKDEFTMSSIQNNMGIIFEEQEDLDKALEYYVKAYKYKKKVDNKEGMIVGYHAMGGIYQKQGKYKLASDLYNNALEIAREAQMKGQITKCYKNLSDLYQELNNPQEAFKYYKLYTIYKDSVFNETKSEQIAEMQTKYETEKKEKENVLLKKDNEIKILKIASKDKTIFFLILGILIIAVLLILIFWQLYQKRKAYNILVMKNLKIVKAEKEYGLFIKAVDDEEIENILRSDKKENKLNDDSQNQIEKLINYMNEEKPYLYSDISLDDISHKLNTNRSYLSKLVNEHFNRNFNEFINVYRIKTARQLLADPDKKHISIEGVGQMAGFNSKSTFFTSFKKFTGITPSYFRNSIPK